MKIQDIQIGKFYRLKNTAGEYCDYYGWVKPLEIYKRGQWDSPNKKKNLVKCEHVVDKNSTVGFIRYFSPSELVDTNEK